MREKIQKEERENVEFRQRGYRNSSAQFCCLNLSPVYPSVECSEEKKKKKGNCGNAIAEIGEKKKFFFFIW